MRPVRLATDVVPLSDAKKRFSELCESAVRNARPLLVTRRGRSYVAVIPIAEFEALTDYRREVELERGLIAALQQVDDNETVGLRDVQKALSRYTADADTEG